MTTDDFPCCSKSELPTPPADHVREALARLIDPEAWRDVQPHSAAFYDDAEAQGKYEGFFWEGVRERRAPSLEAADRILAAFEVRPRGTVTDAGPVIRQAMRVGNALRAAGYQVPMTVLRPALESAREARS